MARRERKAMHRNMLLNRVQVTLADLYHNATPNYPICNSYFESEKFQSWFEFYAQYEIEYIQDGGAYPDIQSTADFVSKQCKSVAAGIYAAKKFLREARIEHSRPHAAWECINEFGKLYTYGRGGRTLAPDKLIDNGSCWHIKKNHFEESNAETITRAILVLESFNKFVRDWNKSVAASWEEEKKETGMDIEIAAEPVRRRIVDSLELCVV